ncbi:MAG: magnesium/cobalt transporter CorA [Deltaproteobacteria bacterium]|nr:magnesium/cobalt transporter CorA [Deltaproteobacteria bacterium]
MFRVLTSRPEGPVTVLEGDDAVAPPAAGELRWIDLAAHGEEDLQVLTRHFRFHPLSVEDCLHFDQRPKLEEFDDHLFLVVHGFACPDQDPRKLTPVELHAFLGKDYLVTVHAEEVPGLDAVFKRVSLDPALVRRGVDFLYYLVLDAMVDLDFQHVDLVSDALDDIEEAVLARAQHRDLSRIFELKRVLITMRRTLSPQRDVLAILAKRGSAFIDERTTVYFRDVYDHLVRISEAIDAARDILGNALDAYLSSVGQRTNEIMKRLTILSAVFLPLTFVTGFFGQNFDALPIHQGWILAFVVVLCITLPVAMLRWFRSQGWL